MPSSKALFAAVDHIEAAVRDLRMLLDSGGQVEHSNSLLTEAEVAVILRKGRSAVKHLRLSGKLAYIPGKPPLIQRHELETYLRKTRVTESTRPLPRLRLPRMRLIRPKKK